MARRAARSISNITNSDELLRYAATAQLELLSDGALGVQASQAQVARLIQTQPANLTAALKGRLTDQMLARFDSAAITLAPDMARTGGLVSLAARLRDVEISQVHYPPGWTRELLRSRPADAVGVLAQASALLSAFEAAHSEAGRISLQYKDELAAVVDRLIRIGVAPPTARSGEALLLLGSLAHYAFDVVAMKLAEELRGPLGFRVWRAVTKVVRLRDTSSRRRHLPTRNLRDWVRLQLADAESLRGQSLYPARSLDLELALSVPPDWSPPDDDWAGRLLLERAKNCHATVRERGTAALGLWERAVRHGRVESVRDELQRLLKDFESVAEDAVRNEVATGLRWVAANLRQNIDTGVAVSTNWPEIDERCLQVTRTATADLDEVPASIQAATRILIEHAILQNAGVHRRRAIDTLRAGGWTDQASRALGRVLENPDSDAWLRCRALFAIGFLQERGPGVQAILRLACEKARYRLALPDPARAQVSEMHAALFAVGDCFGAEGAEEGANWIRKKLDEPRRDPGAARPPGPDEPGLLKGLVDISNRDTLYPIARAAAYMVTFTAAKPSGNPSEDPSGPDSSEELLGALAKHPDTTTQNLARRGQRRLKKLHNDAW